MRRCRSLILIFIHLLFDLAAPKETKFVSSPPVETDECCFTQTFSYPFFKERDLRDK